MKVGERTESNHQSLEVDMGENKGVRGKEIKRFKTVVKWDENSIKNIEIKEEERR